MINIGFVYIQYVLFIIINNSSTMFCNKKIKSGKKIIQIIFVYKQKMLFSLKISKYIIGTFIYNYYTS